MSSPVPGPHYHPGAPHIRTKQQELPPDVAQRPAAPYGGDFETWVLTGNWESVSSSNVAAIAYDAKTETAKVRYINGAEWAYDPVPMDLARRLYLTGSKGIFINDYFKVRGKGNKGKHQLNARQI